MDVSLDKLAPALVALQADLTPVAKTANNPFFKSSYAPLTEVMQTVQPLLAKHKLAVTQFVTHLDGGSALRTILLHESGQRLEDTQPLLLAKQDPQGQGSAITYARRYGVMAVLGLVADEDDDGNAASKAQPATVAYDGPTDDQLDLIEMLALTKGKDTDWLKKLRPALLTAKDAADAIAKLEALDNV